MEYHEDIVKEAFEFLSELESDIKQSIIEGIEYVGDIELEESGYGDIHDHFHLSVIDRSLSLGDAAYILEHSQNEETDSGLWEGQDMRTALQTCAAFTYGNDVWEEVMEQYNALRADPNLRLQNYLRGMEGFDITPQEFATPEEYQYFNALSNPHRS